MVRQSKTIQWYIEKPERLLMEKPYLRGGDSPTYITDYKEVLPNSMVDARDGYAQSDNIKYAISQDVYLAEYNPYAHAVQKMAKMPQMRVTLNAANGNSYTLMQRITLSSAYQKVIHGKQIQMLTHAKMQFELCNRDDEDLTPEMKDDFTYFQQLWNYENMESYKADIYSCQKSSGNVGVLFENGNFDWGLRVLRYADFYKTISNYDDFGRKIATTVYYTIDDGKVECIDTYTKDKVYRFEKNKNTDTSGKSVDTEFVLIDTAKPHGYSNNPLLEKRGVVAWEYVQSYITILEMMENILAACQKEYSTFMLAIYGATVDDLSMSDAMNGIISVQVENDPDGKVKIEPIEFPEKMGIYKYVEHLKEQIQTLSFTTLGTSKEHVSGSDSRGGAMTLRLMTDLALAKQTVNDYAKFWGEFTKLLQEAFDNKFMDGAERFRKLMIKPDPQVWTPSYDSLMIDNIKIAIEGGFISKQTAIEISPLSRRDEVERCFAEAEQAKEDALALQQQINTNNTTEGNTNTNDNGNEESND